MTDIYIPKTPMREDGHARVYQLTQASCKVNIENWRLCAANAIDRSHWNEAQRCQRKARKIAGWLEDLIEERSY